MNRDTFNAPDDQNDSRQPETPRQRDRGPVASPEDDSTPAGLEPERPIAGVLGDTVVEQPVRTGSPFAADPLESHGNRPTEVVYDVGPVRYTAMGAVAASLMVVAFAGAVRGGFPQGGALIAGFGCILSVFGMYSAYRITASALLVIHLSLFVLSYARSIA